MPVTLTIPEGFLSQPGQAQLFAALTDAVLDVSGLTGNPFMSANIFGTINVLPAERVLVGGAPESAVFVELKLPSLALATTEEKRAFIKTATDLVEQACEGRLPRERIWVNIVYAPEGAWGIAGRAYTSADFIAAITGQAA